MRCLCSIHVRTHRSATSWRVYQIVIILLHTSEEPLEPLQNLFQSGAKPARGIFNFWPVTIIQFVECGLGKTIDFFAKFNIEEEEEEMRGWASGCPRNPLTPPINILDPSRLPLCQTARLCVLFRPRASLYGQFCACRRLEEGGGHSCTHALGTAAPLPHTGFMRTPANKISRLKPSARCSYALL